MADGRKKAVAEVSAKVVFRFDDGTTGSLSLSEVEQQELTQVHRMLLSDDPGLRTIGLQMQREIAQRLAKERYAAVKASSVNRENASKPRGSKVDPRKVLDALRRHQKAGESRNDARSAVRQMIFSEFGVGKTAANEALNQACQQISGWESRSKKSAA